MGASAGDVLVNSNPGLPTSLLSFEKQKQQHRLFRTAISLEIALLLF
jgi:hypothetical protein